MTEDCRILEAGGWKGEKLRLYLGPEAGAELGKIRCCAQFVFQPIGNPTFWRDTMFSKDDLQELVNIAGYALETEDRFIAGCVAMHPELYQNTDPAGILRFNNERYYQFLIARSLMSGFPYRVELERDTYDIALYASSDAGPKDFAAVGEIKRWMSSTGEPEIPAIRQDIEKLKLCRCPKFLLIITASPLGKTQENIEFLAEKLAIEPSCQTDPYVFRTSGGRNGFVEASVFAFFLGAGCMRQSQDDSEPV